MISKPHDCCNMSRYLSSEDVVDLGLGDGLRPGAPPKDTQIAHTPVMLSRQSSGISRQDSMSDNESEQTNTEKKSTSRFLEKIKKLKYGKFSSGSNNKTNGTRSYSDPDVNKLSKGRSHSFGCSTAGVSVYAEIPLGTSLRQQRELFEKELHQMLGQHEVQKASTSKSVSPNRLVPGVQIDKSLIAKKLEQTKQEVELLKQDLELCQQQLESKYIAIKIMQGEAYAVHKEDLGETKKLKLLNRQLQDEVNKLQFEMDCRESNLNNSQDTWTDRFDRACQENCALMSSLEEKSLALKKIHAEKMAVCRERDELLALVDVQERQRFEALREQSPSSEETFYNNFTSIELAILGACQCRGHSLEPCGCAQAAAKMKQDIGRLKDQITEKQKCLEEAKIVTDTYRMAFEEQLARNRELIKRLAEMTAEPQMSRVEKAKGAMRWLIKQLNEEVYAKDYSTPNTSEEELAEKDPRDAFRTDIQELFATIPEDTGKSLVEVKKKEPPGEKQEDKHDLDNKSDNEIIELLADMIADKSEALAHQRLTSKLLAKRNEELEQQLTCLTEGEDLFKEETNR